MADEERSVLSWMHFAGKKWSIVRRQLDSPVLYVGSDIFTGATRSSGIRSKFSAPTNFEAEITLFPSKRGSSPFIMWPDGGFLPE